MMKSLITLSLLLSVGCSYAASNWGVAYWGTYIGAPKLSREAAFYQWVRYYQKLMGVEEELVIAYDKDPDAPHCAFVTPDVQHPNRIYVVLVMGDPRCDTVPVEHFAIHEVCHVRYKHLYPPQLDMTTAEKHYEVNQCMKEYRRRRDEAR